MSPDGRTRGAVGVTVQAMSAVNLDWYVGQLQDAVKTMFGVEISRSTAYRFQQKHSDIISFEQPKSLGKSQTAPDLFDKVKAFAD